MLGNLGILKAKMRPEARAMIEERLFLKSRPWRDNPPTEVRAWTEDDDYLWVPRFFFSKAAETGLIGKHKVDIEWTEGLPQDLPQLVTLEEMRGQPKAVDTMEAYLRQSSGGLLCAPTGCGKTILGYTIGRRFKTSLGVLVYNGQMLDNWIETANQVFGLGEDDVGVVQSDRCDIGKPVTVMMVQSLLSRVYPEELYRQIGFLIADEVNRYGAPQWNEVVQQFPARYRIGLSADPTREDGLDPLIEWHFGDIGHSIKMSTPKPTVVQICYGVRYKESRYRDYLGQNEDGSVEWGDANPMKYDKVAAKDVGRNKMIVDELVHARRKKRRILVFSKFRDHLDALKQMFEVAWNPGILDAVAATDDDPRVLDNLSIPTKITMLVGGLKAEQRAEAMEGEVVFTTYALARDALNMPSIDTLLFATAPGNPLQPIGRLRDKGSKDRRPLLALDIFEKGKYSEGKARRRRTTYKKLGIKVKPLDRKQRPAK